MTDSNLCRIVCAKFDNNIQFEPLNSKKQIYYPKCTSFKKNVAFKAIATDGEQVFDGRKKVPLNVFYSYLDVSTNETLIVLTEKEKSAIFSWALRYQLHIVVLETSFPIFSGIKYLKNIKANYQRLVVCLDYLKSLGVTSKSLAASYSSELVKTIKRKVRYKTNLDKHFHLAYLPPFQEVFKFSEEREDRCVIALDFNSMFSSCLEGDFLEPKSAYFNEIDCFYIGQDLQRGLYRVLLRKPIESFFRYYHPFKYTKLNKSYTFYLEDNHEVEILLFKNEIEYYAKFFGEVFIVSGVFSENHIGHPLYVTSKKLYRKRLKAKKSNKNELQKLYKLRLAMLHSATNPLRLVSQNFDTEEEVKEYVNKNYGINISDNSEKFDLLDLKHPKYFKLYSRENSFDFKGVDVESSDCLFSFSSQVLATSRLKVCKLIERLNSFPQLDVCYINTDSIHISIPKKDKSTFFEQYSDVINDDMGALKVQAVGDKAFWFDVGRYFIIKDQKVSQYKNFMLNHKGNIDPFFDNRRVFAKFKSSNFEHVVEFRITLSSTLTYRKCLVLDNKDSVKTIDFSRFSFSNIKATEQSDHTIMNEMISSCSYKEDTYRKLKLCY
jgi:hypothetical protein